MAPDSSGPTEEHGADHPIVRARPRPRSLWHAPPMGRVLAVLLSLVVVAELLGIIGIAAALLWLGGTGTLVVGTAMLVVALAAGVVALRAIRAPS